MANMPQLQHNTFAAYCRRRGAFKTNWNDELLEGVLSVLETPWLIFEAWILAQRLKLEKDVESVFAKNAGLLEGINYKDLYYGFHAADKLQKICI